MTASAGREERVLEGRILRPRPEGIFAPAFQASQGGENRTFGVDGEPDRQTERTTHANRERRQGA